MTENDPNVIFGGEPDEDSVIDPNCPSLGHQIVEDLNLGENKTSFINGITGEIWTYRDMLEQSKLMARTLHGAGLKQNDVISIISENRHEYPAISYGAFYLNAIVAPVNVTYTERELKHSLDLSKPKFVFVSPFAAKRTIAVCKKLHYVQKVILFSDKSSDSSAITLSAFIKKNEEKDFSVEENVNRKVDIIDQVAVIVCSSGTTGLPKGVLLTQKNLMLVVQMYRNHYVMMKMLLGQTVVSMNIAPWFHVLGFMAMFMISCSRDCTFVFLPKFEEASFLNAIEKYKVTGVTVVPPIMVFLAKTPLVDKYDLSSLRSISCGAAALSKEVQEQVRGRFKQEIIIRQGYGMSEATFGIIGTKALFKPGSVGEVLTGFYVKLVDANGKSLGPNQRGELWYKGNQVMKGYINDKKATSETIDKDGWLHSGDIAYYDEDKQFYIVDRLKELIKYKAFQVPPAEIEGLLLSNPKIKDCGVIGVPDEESGELPFAFVVKQPAAKLTEKEVKDFVAENASKPKWLRGGVKFIEQIPKNPSGKILRRELRDLYRSTKAKL